MDPTDRLEQAFGAIAVEKGFATIDQINRAFAEQKGLAEKGKSARIRDILVHAEIITQEQEEEILEHQKQIHAAKYEQPSARTGDQKAQEVDGIELTISEDKMEAFVALKKDTAPSDLQALKDLLARQGIRFGIADDSRIAAYLASAPPEDKPLRIAQGEKPDPGKPATIQYHFDTGPQRVGTLDDDGNIDFKDRGEIPQVADGDLLAEIVCGKSGRPGKDIYGESVDPPEHAPVQLLCAKGARTIEEGNKAIAEISGRPALMDDGRIGVANELLIAGDVGVETGHVEFDGHINVKGSIQNGYRVKGKSLSADEILKADIDVVGDIVVTKGIIGANILTDGKVNARFIHNTTIDALGDINIMREVHDSRIVTNGALNIERGTIFCSSISAMKGIKASEVGSDAAEPSRLTVGVDNRLGKAVARINMQIEEQESAREKINGDVKEIKALVEKIEDEVGEKAQEQDRLTVKGRALKETVKSLKEADDRKNLVKAAMLVKVLDSKLEALQKELDILFGKLEQTEEEIMDKQKEVKKINGNIEELQEDVRSLIEMDKIRKNTAMVKASGKIHDRTFIEGQNASLAVKGDISHVMVRETAGENQGGNSQWAMAISRLR